MKNNIQNTIMHMVISFCVICGLICGSFAFPVLASESDIVPLDYNDYVSSVVVDGDNDIVTVSLPTDNCYFRFQSSASLYYFNTGSSLMLTDLPVGNYQLLCFPLGTYFTSSIAGYTGVALDISNIPDGTTISFSYYIRTHHSSDSIAGLPATNTLSIKYLDTNGSVLKSATGRVTTTYSTNVDGYTALQLDLDYSLDNSVLASYLIFSTTSNMFSVTEVNDYFNISLESFNLTMSISSLYRMTAMSGQTNKLLYSIDRQLQQQGSSLQTIINNQTIIINGSSEQQQVADDFNSAVSEKTDILDNAVSDMQIANKPEPTVPNIDDYVDPVGVDILVNTVQPILSDNLILPLLMMVAILMLGAYVLFGKRG